MDVLSVEEAWAVAKGIVGNAELIGSSTSYYGSVAQLMQANGWNAVTKGSEVLYYTRPAQIAIESGVKTYTEVASVSNVVTAESGAVTSATATTTGLGVSVAKSAIAGAAAACFGYNVGTKIYEQNPEWWDGALETTNKWIVDNVPENGVTAMVTVLNGIDTVLSFPSDLMEELKAYSINTGVYDSSAIIDVPTETSGTVSVTNSGISFELFSAFFEKAMEYYGTRLKESVKNHARQQLHNIYNDTLATAKANNYDAFGFNFYADFSNLLQIGVELFKANNTVSIGSSGSGKCGDWRSTGATGYWVTWWIYSNSYRKSYEHFNSGMDLYIGYYESSTSDVGTFQTCSYNATFGSNVPGTTKQENATYPSANTPISDTYPDWWKNVVLVSNGENGIIKYIPVSITDKDVKDLGDDQTQEQAQSGTNTNPKDNTNIKVKEDKDSGNDDKITNPDSTDTGDTPILPPSTSIFGIAGVYNPTLEQIKSFTSWLWSENPITQLQQMFSNPMNAIIGLHLIYATPSTSAEKSIGVGYLDSGVLSKVVSEQYVTIDCGSVSIPSYYNNVNDWSPYTKISCYLPFIGIVKLNTDDLMSSDGNISQLNITYKVDVLTGACLAMLKVKRGSSDAILYQYNGSCSVQLPLTSGNYGGIIASLITTAVGVVSGFTPLAIGGAMSLTHPKADIQRSGQLGANVGAMGIKKPYLIIERPYSKYASSYAKHVGYPSNNTLKLSACHGFTRVKSTDVNNINTTEEERKMILDLLTSGIYI